MQSRYRPVGWRNESYRHYLAGKGIKTRYDNRFFVEKDAKGRILCEECGLPLNVKRPLVDKKCRCDRSWFSKKPMPSINEFVEQIREENKYLPHSELQRLAVERRLKALSEKEHGRGEYFAKEQLTKTDWKDIKKRITGKKDQRSALFEEIWERKKPHDEYPVNEFVAEVSDVPYSGRKQKSEKQKSEKVADVVSKGVKIEVKSRSESKTRKSKDEDDLPHKQPKYGKLGGGVVLEHWEDPEFAKIREEFEKSGGKLKTVKKEFSLPEYSDDDDENIFLPRYSEVDSV